MALGALIIKARLGLTDEELVEQISENPYLQFFIGLEGSYFSAVRSINDGLFPHTPTGSYCERLQ